MIYIQNFWEVWGRSLDRGEIKTRYNNGGKTIEIGLTNTLGIPSYYVREVLSNGIRSLDGEVEERFIDGTDFVIQLNEPRGYKPVTNNSSLIEGAKEHPKSGIENCVFSCNDKKKNLSLLVRDPSGQIVLKHGRYNLYYNAFPIEEDGHFMYVPVEREGIIERIPHIPQKLTKEVVEDFSRLSLNSEDSILFFNSIHAGASADHLHIQLVCYRRYLKDRDRTPLRNGRYAVENACVERYHGRDMLIDYPIKGIVFDNKNAPLVWEHINKLQMRDIPFNWILIREKSYLVPRKKEFEKVSEFSNILASLEIAGKLVTSDRQTFTGIRKEDLFSAFGKMSYSVDELIQKVDEKNYFLLESKQDSCDNCVEHLTGVAGEPCADCSYKTK